VTPDATRRLAIGQVLLLAAGLVVLTIISAGSVYLVNKAREDARWVVHTVEVENQLSLAQLRLHRAESAQRGYLSTLLPDFQQDFEKAVAQFEPALARLSELIGDNSVQKRLLDEMLPLGRQRIEEFRSTIELARTRRMDDAARIVREGAGRDAMNRIDDLADRMRAEEDRLFVLRTTNADRSQTLAASLTGIGSGFVVVLAGISIFLVRRSARARDDAEVLLREVNHRVGNSLQIIASLLNLQASSSTEEDVKAALTNAMGRVAAVAQVHRRLYTSKDLNSVLLNQYLHALIGDLRRSAEGNGMSRLTLKAEPVEIDPDRAVAIGIIVNELVMNAVKYAYPDGAGPIHVDFNAQGDDLVLAIADDGVGLNVKADPRSTGMGQRIVSAMASKLDASVERDPAHAGTRIVLRFPRVDTPAARPASAAAG
jgi:two-component sensor histidine kinase